MPRAQYCIPCATGTRPVETIATQTVDGDPMCDFHAREEHLAGAPAEEVKRPIALVAPSAPAPRVDPEPSLLCVACESVNIVTPATTEFNGDAMCEHHAFIARRKLVKACSRGCGKPPHRGRCAGAEGRRATLPPQRMASTHEIPVAKYKPSAAALEAVARANASAALPVSELEGYLSEGSAVSICKEERRGHLDKLVGEEIDLGDLPAAVEPSRNSHGRIGELMAWLKSAPEGKAFAAKCRDVKHVSQTHKGVRDAAKRLGIRFYWRRNDATYYISRSEFPGGERAWE